MVVRVSDTTSHRRDQIANLAELLRNRPTCQSLVQIVYFGKKREKSVPFLARELTISTKRVTEIGKPLVNSFFTKKRDRENGKVVTFYVKDDFVRDNLRKILQLANSRKRLDAYHTKSNPRLALVGRTVKVTVPFKPNSQSITIDDVREFAKVCVIDAPVPNKDATRLPENTVKRGLIKILGEETVAKDWGGEFDDIFTTRITVAGRRRRAAFALKGPAKSGPLVPKMMGKNGDQIQRLFTSPAQVFFVQYEGEIKESIIHQMSQLALAKATTEREVFYGVIDLKDTHRLRLAYPKVFEK
jgi:hypothetical protein